MGLALMEEIQVRDGIIRNPSFTDYLIPTILDMPPMTVDVLELRRPALPVRAARCRRATHHLVRRRRSSPRCGRPPARPCTRVPVRPEHITGT